MLDRARPVDDPEPEQCELEAGAPRVQLQAQLRVDLREVREVALHAVGMLGPDLAAQRRPVDVQRAGVDERGAPERGDRLGDVPRAGEVRLLGVVGLALGERPAGLRGEQVARASGRSASSRSSVLAAADVGGLHAGAARLEPGQLLALGGVPVVGERDLLARVEGELRERRADVAGAEDQEQGVH